MSDFLSDNDFDGFRQYIYSESGIHFSKTNRSILESRLKERLRNNDSRTPGDYLNLLKSNKEETRLFLDAITTNLTRFFRNQAHYDTLIQHVIPQLIKYKTAKGDKRIRSWNAGCSSGEEPYTNAMVFKEHLPPGWEIEITASDLSLKSLMTAKEGVYPETRMSSVPEFYQKKYFEPVEQGFKVKDSLKELITFDYHNLKFETGLKDLDIVFCRNVLIYFDEAAQKNVIDHFWKAMSGYAYLFIGHSESLFGMETDFQFVKTDWACIYGKSTGDAAL